MITDKITLVPVYGNVWVWGAFAIICIVAIGFILHMYSSRIQKYTDTLEMIGGYLSIVALILMFVAAFTQGPDQQRRMEAAIKEQLNYSDVDVHDGTNGSTVFTAVDTYDKPIYGSLLEYKTDQYYVYIP